ncbi:hypothetical protein [Limnofasciculus baicalensis]|uniref:Uncharacterized protein n=1 Tax=Limnofasciculus baicalensis BBK-W-15 TaxID=2699891 RepID=A0AAE3GU38_9CYAN|nr:hypothetical protein [Limnofasciculus baicalensis]MCP2729908.1 hypothetical protein [Limnofasciculus baicalensis BBK-W-15]
MSKLPPDDQRWQEFLRQNRPTPPSGADDLEDQIISAIEKQDLPLQGRRLWAVPPVIAAGLLMAWSGYRTLTPPFELSNSSTKLEAFLENNWNHVVGETSASSPSNSTPDEWMLLANTAP